MAEPNTIAIIALGLAQLAAVVKIAIWAGEKNEKEKTFLTREEFANAKASILEAARAEAARVVDDAKRQLTVTVEHAHELSALRSREERNRELTEIAEELHAAIGAARDEMRGSVGGFANAGSQLEWRIEAIEETIRKKLGTEPRLLAVRPRPELRGAPVDPEATNPGIGQPARAFLSPVKRHPSGPLGGRPLPRTDPDEHRVTPIPPKRPQGK